MLNAGACHPTPIHRGILADIRDIKRLVEEAISLAVRATNQQSVIGRRNISKERQYRMLSLAASKLSIAYGMNEVATAVATMQSASILEDIAVKILKKYPEELDALHVHFFHERIPSRQLAENTTFETLDRLIRSQPLEAHLLRTRATVLTFKEEHLAAVKDLTAALNLVECNKARYQGGSLESQLLFMRAEAYQTLSLKFASSFMESKSADDKKRVRIYARRSIRDFLKFCSHLEYTHHLRSGQIVPVSALLEANLKPALLPIAPPPTAKLTKEDITRRVAIARAKRAIEITATSVPGRDEVAKVLAATGDDVDRAALTYHPLLPECLHNLLMSHVLAGTPFTEIKRHAMQVLQISKLCEGYPVFRSPRSAAKSDWTELLRRQGKPLIGSTVWNATVSGLPDNEPKVYSGTDRAETISEWLDTIKGECYGMEDQAPNPPRPLSIEAPPTTTIASTKVEPDTVCIEALTISGSST